MRKYILFIGLLLFIGLATVLLLVEWEESEQLQSVVIECPPAEEVVVEVEVEVIHEKEVERRSSREESIYSKYKRLNDQYILWVDDRHRRECERDKSSCLRSGMDGTIALAGEVYYMYLVNIDQEPDTYDDFRIQLRKLPSFHAEDDWDFYQDATFYEGEYDQIEWSKLSEEEMMEVIVAINLYFPDIDLPETLEEMVDLPTLTLYELRIFPTLPGTYTLNVTSAVHNALWDDLWGEWRHMAEVAATLGKNSHWKPPKPVYVLHPFIVTDPTPELRRDILPHNSCDDSHLQRLWLGPAQPVCPDESTVPGLNSHDTSKSLYFDRRRSQWYNQDCATRQLCKDEALACLRRFRWILVLGDSIARELNSDLQHVLHTPANLGMIWADDLLKVVTPSFAVMADKEGLSADIMKWRDFRTRRDCNGPQFNWNTGVLWKNTAAHYDGLHNVLDYATKDDMCDHETIIEQSFFTADFEVNPNFPYVQGSEEIPLPPMDMEGLPPEFSEKLSWQAPIDLSTFSHSPDICILGVGMHKVWSETWDSHEQNLHRNLKMMGPPSSDVSGKTLDCTEKFVLLLPSAQHDAGVRNRRRVLEWNKRTADVARSYGAKVIDNFYPTDIVPEWCGGTHMSYARAWVPGPQPLDSTPFASSYYLPRFISQLCPDLGTELSFEIGGQS